MARKRRAVSVQDLLHCQLVGGKDYLNVQNELNICTTDVAYSQTLIQSLETWCAMCREDVSDDGQ